MRNIIIRIRVLLIAIFVTFFHWTYCQNHKLQINTDSIVYLNEVSSLDSLLCMFKGHVIYVDFWASWCKPCITELAEQPELETYFQSHGIVRLYIAIEQIQTDPTSQASSIDKWKKMVEKYNLIGFNYYSQLRTPFFSGITDKIMKGKISLPRFAIVDKNGVIVEMDAKRPSEAEKLTRQIAQYLENK